MAARKKTSSSRSSSSPTRTPAPRADTTTGRVEQKARTRLALVESGLQLLRSGHNPTIREVAEAAGVSAATAYRYFPSTPALWDAVVEHAGVPDVNAVLERAGDDDAQARVEALARITTRRFHDDEMLWRTASAALHLGGLDPNAARDRVLQPTGRRMQWIDTALKPLAARMHAAELRRLRAALYLVLGTEAMVSLSDVSRLGARQAREVSLWAARALVQAAIDDIEWAPQPKRPGAAKPGKAKPGKAKPGKAKPGKAKPSKAKPGKAKPSKGKPAHKTKSR